MRDESDIELARVESLDSGGVGCVCLAHNANADVREVGLASGDYCEAGALTVRRWSGSAGSEEDDEGGAGRRLRRRSLEREMRRCGKARVR